MKKIEDSDMLIPDTCEAFTDKPLYEIEEYRSIESLLEEFSVAVDVGAHVGFWSKRLCSSFDRVIAFEAVPDVYKCLDANLAGTSNIEHHGLAIGPRFGSADLLIDEEDSGAGKVVRQPTEDKITQVCLDDFLAQDGGLDNDVSFEESVDFIKIDVEGFEVYVLDGAVDIIKLYRPVVCIKVEHEDDDRTDDVLLPLNYKKVETVGKYNVWKYDDKF